MSDFLTAQFPVAVLEVVNQAGIFPQAPVAPGAQYVPAGYTGPQVVFSAAGGVGPVVSVSAPNFSTMTMAQPSELANGDLQVFVANYDTGTVALAPASGSSVATQISSHAYSNGRLQLWILPYATGDGAPTFTGASHFFWGYGFILRKPAGATAQSDQQALDTASLIGNFGLESPSFITPTQNNSCVIWYFAQYAPANANGNNQLIAPVGGVGFGETPGSAQNPETWQVFTIANGSPGNVLSPFWLGASYRLDKARTAQLVIPYIGNAAGASNNPAGVANFY